MHRRVRARVGAIRYQSFFCRSYGVSEFCCPRRSVIERTEEGCWFRLRRSVVGPYLREGPSSNLLYVQRTAGLYLKLCHDSWSQLHRIAWVFHITHPSSQSPIDELEVAHAIDRSSSTTRWNDFETSKRSVNTTPQCRADLWMGVLCAFLTRIFSRSIEQNWWM